MYVTLSEAIRNRFVTQIPLYSKYIACYYNFCLAVCWFYRMATAIGSIKKSRVDKNYSNFKVGKQKRKKLSSRLCRYPSYCIQLTVFPLAQAPCKCFTFIRFHSKPFILSSTTTTTFNPKKSCIKGHLCELQTLSFVDECTKQIVWLSDSL